MFPLQDQTLDLTRLSSLSYARIIWTSLSLRRTDFSLLNILPPDTTNYLFVQFIPVSPTS
jgi:hypothetical protein